MYFHKNSITLIQNFLSLENIFKASGIQRQVRPLVIPSIPQFMDTKKVKVATLYFSQFGTVDYHEKDCLCR